MPSGAAHQIANRPSPWWFVEHHQERALAADEERGRAVARALARLRQREAELADPRQRPPALGCVHHAPMVA